MVPFFQMSLLHFYRRDDHISYSPFQMHIYKRIITSIIVTFLECVCLKEENKNRVMDDPDYYNTQFGLVPRLFSKIVKVDQTNNGSFLLFFL